MKSKNKNSKKYETRTELMIDLSEYMEKKSNLISVPMYLLTEIHRWLYGEIGAKYIRGFIRNVKKTTNGKNKVLIPSEILSEMYHLLEETEVLK